MRLPLAAIIASLFLLPNNLFADVRIDEHHLSRIFHEMNHHPIPDPLSDIAPLIPRPRRLFRMPADGRISSPFGWRRDPFLGVKRFHSGMDIANFKSPCVVAAAGGRVVKAGRAAGCGLMVVLNHGGETQTRYCHLRKLFVSRGEEVEAGCAIGRMGATGRSTGTHLHFEILEGGVAVDPAPRLWLAFAPE
ncbi:MAG TPA: M23 family metallopeptidase [bacterium]|nr:M23 family metallopeptidase [bacterium]